MLEHVAISKSRWQCFWSSSCHSLIVLVSRNHGLSLKLASDLPAATHAHLIAMTFIRDDIRSIFGALVSSAEAQIQIPLGWSLPGFHMALALSNPSLHRGRQHHSLGERNARDLRELLHSIFCTTSSSVGPLYTFEPQQIPRSCVTRTDGAYTPQLHPPHHVLSLAPAYDTTHKQPQRWTQ